MQYTQLGKTGLTVSVAGLGGGGNSCLGKAQGKSEAQSIALVHRAIDLGVNFLDTAAAYGTEAIVGKAVKSLNREDVVVSTKALSRKQGNLLTADELCASLDQSLRTLDMDYVDIFHLHAVRPDDYDYALNELAPALLKEKQRGKLRHLGITETGPLDPGQTMLQRAVHDDCWEVMMLAFHMLHQKARQKVFPYTQQNGIGTLLMFVVRNIFSQPQNLQNKFSQLAADKKLPDWLAEQADPLDFLIHAGGASSLTDAAYRYARHEPGSDVVLFGTGDEKHLELNIASILKPPLPEADRDRLSDLFGHLEGVGLDLPSRR